MPKKLLLLVNPYSGSGKSLAACEYLKRNLPGYEFNTLVSQYKGHFVDFLQKEDLSQYEKIIIFGGDGTMHEVTNGIAEKGSTPPLLLFPCGGGKALNHDINNLDWESSMQKFHQNNIKQIDIFRVEFPNAPANEKTLYG
ncbi:MAG TPA: acylglycerol kinase family protein, partial [Emticicia sp.]